MDLEQLRCDGYTVVEGVAGPEQIEPLLALAQEASGVVLDDPSTWDPDRPELLELRGHPAQVGLREHPPLYEAFAAVYPARELAVSQDRLGVKVPGGAACASTTTWRRTTHRPPAPGWST